MAGESDVDAFARKRALWLHALVSEDPNSVFSQLLGMSWDVAVFRTVRLALQLARRRGQQVPDAVSVHEMLKRQFFICQMLAVRRATDGYAIDNSERGTYALLSILEDMTAHRALLTRSTIMAVEYGVRPRTGTNEMLAGVREDRISVLAGKNHASDDPGDAVSASVLLNLQAKTLGARGIVKVIVDKYYAHAATPSSRAHKQADSASITLDDLWKAHRILTEVTAFLSVYVLGDSCPFGFVARSVDDPIQGFNKVLCPTKHLESLRAEWERVSEESNEHCRWDLDSYRAEFGTVT